MGNCITVSELARRLGIGRSAAYALVTSAEFYPAFRLGKRVLISEEALARWVEERTDSKGEFCG